MAASASSTRLVSLPTSAVSGKTWLLIVVLGVLFRAAFVHKFPSQIISDQNWNDAVAWNLVQGNGFTASQQAPFVPGVFRTPGYMVFMAGIYAIVGHQPTMVLYGQAVLDALSAILIGLIALPFFGRRVAITVAVLYALYPYSASLCTQLSQDIVLTFAVLGCLFFASRGVVAAKNGDNRNAALWWLGCGVALGWAALVKAFLLLFLPIPLVAIALLPQMRAVKLRWSALLCAGLALTIGPWVVRNYLIFQAFPPLAVGGTGRNMALLVKELDGGEAGLVESFKPRDYTKGLRAGYREEYLREMKDGRELIAYERRLTQESAPKIRARLPEYAALTLGHIPRLWITQGALGRSGFVVLAAKIVSYLVVIPGLIGIWLCRKRWRDLLPFMLAIFWLTVTYAPYTAEARYTLPVRPVMLMFGAVALIWVWDKLRRQHTLEIEASV